MSVVDPISAADAAAHRAHGDAIVVDARPQVVRHQGSLPGAIVVDPTDVRAAFSPTSSAATAASAVRKGAIGLDTEIAVVSVHSQAPVIAEQIADLGYTNVRYVAGDYVALTARTD